MERAAAAADALGDEADVHLQLMARILVMTALLAAAMYAVAHGDVLAKARLVGTCTVVAAPVADGSMWHSCRAGRLEGWPDLTKKSCTHEGFVRDRQMWRCPAPVIGSRAS